MSDRFKLSVVEMGKTYSALFYDLVEKKIVDELTDYSDQLINHLHLKRLSIQQEVGYLRVFWGFLAAREVSINAVSDNVIKDFRAYALEMALTSRSHRNCTRSRKNEESDASKATVNAKLIRIYDWLMWLQETGRVPENTIGYRNAAVQSALRGSSLSREARKNKELRGLDKYPLLLDDRTRNSKHSVPRFIPSEDTVDELHAYFMDGQQSLHIRHRNVLMIDVATYTGFRRNSIQSLHIDQFIGTNFLLTDHDTVIIKPSRQKFDYGDTYEIPVVLHDNVRIFTETYRAAFLTKKGIDERVAKGAVFVSDKTCKPLNDRTITTIVSKALRKFGAPKGTAIHSFRAKYLTEAIADEYDERRALKLDTSDESVTLAVARKAGQKNPQSLRPYISSRAASLLIRNKSERLRREQKLQQANELLQEEVTNLRAILSKKV